MANYDPETEAVALASRYEAIHLHLVWEGGVETLGTLAFVTAT